jgi:hypothetical protein
MWLLSMLGSRPAASGVVARASWFAAVIGVAMVTAGAFMETSFVNPDRDFFHPLVQGGWVMFIAGLFPVAFLGILGMAIISDRARRISLLVLAVLAPLPVVAFVFGEYASTGVVATVVFALLHAAPGFGLVLHGIVLRRETVNTPVGY